MGKTQEKGDLGVCIALAELEKNKVKSSLPISESLHYDIIGDYNGVLKRIQVRYASQTKEGTIFVKLKAVWSNAQGYQVRNRKKGDYDILCVYCPNTDECYFLMDEDFDAKNGLTLRVKEAKLNMKTIKYAREYRDCIRCFGGYPAG